MVEQDYQFQERVSQKEYPEIYISEELDQLLQSNPPIPEKPAAPIEPKLPVRPTEKNTSNTGVAVLCFMGMTAALIFTLTRDRIPTDLLLPITALLLASFFFLTGSVQMRRQYNQKVRDYEEAVKQYPVLKERYCIAKSDFDIKLERYKKEVQSLCSTERLTSFRKNKCQNWLNNREMPVMLDYEDSDKVQKGVAENAFFNLLARDFEVFSNKKVPVGNSFFYPDIVLLINGLCIDIEIDEPYVGNTGEAIHYLDESAGIILASIDQDRNEYMSLNGWETIRFAEEQVILYPNQCLGFIHYFINSLLSGTVSNYYFSQFFYVGKWTKEEANDMANQDYRSTYTSQQTRSGRKYEPASLSGNKKPINGTRLTDYLCGYTKYDVVSYTSEITGVQHTEIVFTNEHTYDEDVVFLAESLGTLSSQDIDARKKELAIYNRGRFLILDVI